MSISYKIGTFGVSLRLSREERKEIGQRVKRLLEKNAAHCAATGDRTLVVSATQLADRARKSPSTIFKLHSGEFSIRTLRIVEAVLGVSFLLDGDPQEVPSNGVNAAIPVGAYTKAQVEDLLGTYEAVKPLDEGRLIVSKVHIRWVASRSFAAFTEENSFKNSKGNTVDYSQLGKIHYNIRNGLIHMLSGWGGSVRLVTVHQRKLHEGILNGAILTQIDVLGGYAPCVSPIHLRRRTAPDFETGVFARTHPRNAELTSQLAEAADAIVMRRPSQS